MNRFMIVIDLCFSSFAQCVIVKNHGKEMYWCVVKDVQKLYINNVQKHIINYQMLLLQVMSLGFVIPLVKKTHEGNVLLLNCQESVYHSCVLPRTTIAAVMLRLLLLHPCCIVASLHHLHLHRYGSFLFFFFHNTHISFIHFTIMHAHRHTHKHTHHTSFLLVLFFISTSCFVYSLH